MMAPLRRLLPPLLLVLLHAPPLTSGVRLVSTECLAKATRFLGELKRLDLDLPVLHGACGEQPGLAISCGAGCQEQLNKLSDLVLEPECKKISNDDVAEEFKPLFLVLELRDNVTKACTSQSACEAWQEAVLLAQKRIDGTLAEDCSFAEGDLGGLAGGPAVLVGPPSGGGLSEEASAKLCAEGCRKVPASSMSLPAPIAACCPDEARCEFPETARLWHRLDAITRAWRQPCEAEACADGDQSCQCQMRRELSKVRRWKETHSEDCPWVNGAVETEVPGGFCSEQCIPFLAGLPEMLRISPECLDVQFSSQVTSEFSEMSDSLKKWRGVKKGCGEACVDELAATTELAQEFERVRFMREECGLTEEELDQDLTDEVRAKLSSPRCVGSNKAISVRAELPEAVKKVCETTKVYKAYTARRDRLDTYARLCDTEAQQTTLRLYNERLEALKEECDFTDEELRGSSEALSSEVWPKVCAPRCQKAEALKEDVAAIQASGPRCLPQDVQLWEADNAGFFKVMEAWNDQEGCRCHEAARARVDENKELFISINKTCIAGLECSEACKEHLNSLDLGEPWEECTEFKEAFAEVLKPWNDHYWMKRKIADMCSDCEGWQKEVLASKEKVVKALAEDCGVTEDEIMRDDGPSFETFDLLCAPQCLHVPSINKIGLATKPPHCANQKAFSNIIDMWEVLRDLFLQREDICLEHTYLQCGDWARRMSEASSEGFAALNTTCGFGGAIVSETWDPVMMERLCSPECQAASALNVSSLVSDSRDCLGKFPDEGDFPELTPGWRDPVERFRSYATKWKIDCPTWRPAEATEAAVAPREGHGAGAKIGLAVGLGLVLVLLSAGCVCAWQGRSSAEPDARRRRCVSFRAAPDIVETKESEVNAPRSVEGSDVVGHTTSRFVGGQISEMNTASGDAVVGRTTSRFVGGAISEMDLRQGST